MRGWGDTYLKLMKPMQVFIIEEKDNELGISIVCGAYASTI